MIKSKMIAASNEFGATRIKIPRIPQLFSGIFITKGKKRKENEQNTRILPYDIRVC